MAAAEPSGDLSAGLESLQRLSSAEPPLFLTPSSELSRHARAASRHLFSSLLPFCPRKSRPCLDRLLADDGFDAEQIWAQIDLLSRPVLAAARNELGRIKQQGPPPPAKKKVVPTIAVEEKVEEEEDEEEEEEEEENDGVDEEDGEEEEEEEELNEVEDQFLKIRELEEYIEDGETREYGGSTGDKKKEGDGDEDEDGEGGDIDLQYGDLGSDEDGDFAENARYTDFFKPTKVRGASKKYDHKKQNSTSEEKDHLHSESEDLEMDDSQKDDIDVDSQDNGTRSTHEKQLLQIQSEIEQMERENMEPKSWFMQGEVTASKRPKNSALEVDLDFEHNAKPPPVDTQEMLVSLEDLMKKRIIEGQFDDVQRAPSLPSKPPRELKEMDESKSKKGLAEIYEEEYAQKTGLAPAPLTFSDEHKKEATILFKKLCTKLDALSHFHFAPKPVIEDMSIQANVPALAMEEIAPLAVSDAAMLAPEEVFKGKGDIKEETELTQEDRKRRRASKKRKFKAETAKREAKKMRQNAAASQSNDKSGKEDILKELLD